MTPRPGGSGLSAVLRSWGVLRPELPSAPLSTHSLCSCELAAPSGRHLASAIRKNQGLTHLNLRRNHLGNEGVSSLSEVLSHADCSLQSLE